LFSLLRFYFTVQDKTKTGGVKWSNGIINQTLGQPFGFQPRLYITIQTGPDRDLKSGPSGKRTAASTND